MEKDKKKKMGNSFKNNKLYLYQLFDTKFKLVNS